MSYIIYLATYDKRSDIAMEEKITLRLPKELLDRLDTLVGVGEFASRSDAVRECLKEGLSKRIQMPMGETEQVTVTLPQRFVSDMDFLVKVDYYPSKEMAAYEAIKIHLYETLDLYKIKTRAQNMQDIGFELADAEMEKQQVTKIAKE